MLRIISISLFLTIALLARGQRVTITPSTNGPYCSGQRVVLTAQVTPPQSQVTFLWSTGENTASITIDSSGFYTITATFLGTSITDTSSFIFFYEPSPFVEIGMNDTTVAAGTLLNITATAIGGQPPYIYRWSNGRSGLSYAHTTILGAETICVTVTDANGCTGSDCLIIEGTPVIPCPTPNFHAEILLPIMPPDTMYVIHQLDVNGIFSWDFGDGSPLSNLPYPTHIYNNDTIYNVCLTYTYPNPANTCTNTFCNRMGMIGGNIFRGSFTMVFMPNLPLSIDEAGQKAEIKAFPNPTNGQLSVELPGFLEGTAEWRISDMMGRRVMFGTEAVGEQGLSLDLAFLGEGAYWLEIINDELNLGTKFVKRN